MQVCVCVCVWKRESLWNAVFMKDYPLWEVCIEIPVFSSAYDLSAKCEYVYLLTCIVSKARNSLEASMQVQGKKTKLNVRHIWVPLCWCSIQTVYSRSLQSRDRLEDLEGKASIELQHKNVNSSSISQPQIFRSPLKRIKQRYFWTKCKFWPFAIHIKHLQQYLNNKPCDKTL